MCWLYPPVTVTLTVVGLVERRCLVAVHRHSLCVVRHVGYLNAAFYYMHAHDLQHRFLLYKSTFTATITIIITTDMFT